MSRLSGVALGLIALTGASTSRAQTSDKTDCAAAYDEGQRAKLRGALMHARDELATCAKESCPASLQPECVQWLDEVNHAMPSIVVQARGHDGSDKVNVRVFADGKLLTEHLDGRPIEMDPGEYDLRFEISGEDIPDQHVLVVEGQKARPVMAIGKVLIAKPVGHEVRPMPVLGWIAGGLGVAALGTFGVFAATGASDYGHLPPCKCGTASNWDRTELIIADVALGAMVAALAVTAIIYFTRPRVIRF